MLVVDHLGQNIHRGEFTRFFKNNTLKEEDIYAEIGDISAERSMEEKVKRKNYNKFYKNGLFWYISVAGLLLDLINED